MRIILRTTQAQATQPQNLCGEKICYRSTGLRRLIGFVYGATEATDVSTCGCEELIACGCNAWNGAKLVLWDYDTHEAYPIESAELTVLDRISDHATAVAEIALKIDGLAFGGFGTCGIRNGSVTLRSANGFCGGAIAAPECKNCVTCGDVVPSACWSICSAPGSNPDIVTEKTAAYGKWTLQMDQSAATRIVDGVMTTPTGFDDAESVELSTNND